MNTYLNDKPLDNVEDDKFSRGKFADRITELVKSYKSEDSIVIGLYGKWGEGKTTVLNFVIDDISELENFIVIKFNPWRYISEKDTIIAFFNLLAESINEKLLTNKERIGETIKKYADIITGVSTNIIGLDAGAATKSIGAILADTDLDKLKLRLNKLILEQEKRIIVTLDDIDRLNNKEIQNLFKLIKLTADFKRTTYVLSFDRELVAAALGDSFGSKSIDEGYKYLEKIIQVPIYLPTISSSLLRDYFFELISEVFESLKIKIEDSEKERFVFIFNKCMLPLMKNPRLAIRLSNTIRFKFPIIYGEVNSGDFIILQAVKIFLPEVYIFIEKYPAIFTSDNNSQRVFSRNSESNEHHLKIIDDQLSKYDSITRKNIEELLFDLFPIYKKKRENKSNYSEHDFQKWYKEKRLGSPLYFNRFFQLSVPKDELSDNLFTDWISLVENNYEDSQALLIFESLLKEGMLDSLLMKLMRIESSLVSAARINISKFFSIVSDKLPVEEVSFIGFYSKSAIIADFIFKALHNVNSFDERNELLIEISNNIENPSLLAQLIRKARPSDKHNDYNDDALSKMTRILVSIYKDNYASLFNGETMNGWLVLAYWAMFGDRETLSEKLVSYIDANPGSAIDIVRAFMSDTTSTVHDYPYKNILTNETYERVLSVLNPEFIISDFNNSFEHNIEAIYNGDSFSGPQSRKDTASQFMYFRNNSVKGEEE
ncbi:hypothetical protein CEQ90_20295 [Lewinellaceae bacterium SD302]|nr:hypothetical protein CEQ90_20295 [Lewinellaceae bacterium SD302]